MLRVGAREEQFLCLKQRQIGEGGCGGRGGSISRQLVYNKNSRSNYHFFKLITLPGVLGAL